jgi:hypothetical protein
VPLSSIPLSLTRRAIWLLASATVLGAVFLAAFAPRPDEPTSDSVGIIDGAAITVTGPMRVEVVQSFTRTACAAACIHDAKAKEQLEVDPAMIVLVRRVRVRNTLIFQGRVEGEMVASAAAAPSPAPASSTISSQPNSGAPADGSFVDRAQFCAPGVVARIVEVCCAISRLLLTNYCQVCPLTDFLATCPKHLFRQPSSRGIFRTDNLRGRFA